jgi:asparagine synthase (glutamine-hydrolysing)
MATSYLGGVSERGGSVPGLAGGENWRSVHEETELFLGARGLCSRLFAWDSLALLIRGYARPETGHLPDLELIAEDIRRHYLEEGSLPTEGLEGSFTLALLDAQAGRVLLYRNLIGAGFTYYRSEGRRFLFGSNLADLVDEAGGEPRPNRDALPAFFLYRWVPGRETLFDGFYRLLPGEQVVWEDGVLVRSQRQTLGELATSGQVSGDPLEGLEEIMGRVLADHAAWRPGAGNLLSGGIDSSYVQAAWNRVAATAEEAPRSFSVSVDHPRTWADTDYAVTASQALGTYHRLIPADDPYAGYLLDVLALTGEPPNHVQTAYFGHLARSMAEQGVTTGLCGEGADSLFGLGLANQIHNALVARCLAPASFLRQGVAALSGALGWHRLAATFRLAGRVNDLTHLDHPVNQVAAFTDWAAVRACFGSVAVIDAAASRRCLLDRFAIPDDPMDRLHAAGYLGEATDSASLWTTLFNRAGADLLCPFLDSRVLRFALGLPRHFRYRFRRPKDLLKRALARHVPAELVRRPKLGFGQPIFEWLAPGGKLRPLVEQIGPHDFVAPEALKEALARPNWFLYSLLCYDLWHKLFIERSLARPTRTVSVPEKDEAVPVVR